MKRKIAFFLTVIMICAALLPMQAFAEKDKALEGVVSKVKQLFDIPSSYTFSPEAYTDNGKKVWNLNWSSKDGDGSISVRADEKGTVLGYDNWKSYDYTARKLPKYSRQEAKAKAEQFIKKVNPAALSQIKLIDNSDSLMDSSYNFSYSRMVNQIPFYNNGISVSVNKETGEVQSYNYNWNDDVTFTDAGKAIGVEAAKKAYIEKLGLRLIYKYTYENDKLGLYVVYTPKYSSAYAIDALTGEKVQCDFGYFDGYGGGGFLTQSKEAMDRSGAALTPEEVKAIDELSNMISQEDAEKIARGIKYLKLTDDFKLESANLSRNWPIKSEYVWYLNFNKGNGKSAGSEYDYASVSINAKTGEVLSFYRNMNSSSGDKAKYNEAQSKQAVEEFLKSFSPDKFKEVEYEDNSTNGYPYQSSSEEQKAFSFNYIRKVNNAYFPSNSINVSFDAVAGEVSSYNMSWFDAQFPALDKALDVSKIYDKLFSEVGLELQYKAKYPDEYYRKIMPQGSKMDVKLIYALKPGKPQFFKADTGELLGDDGKPYKENKPVVYTDIKGHAAEKQITALSEFGVSFEGPKFRPDENVTQLDFFVLLSKTLSYYYGPAITANSSKDEIDNLYKILIREGVVKEKEKNPSGAVTREEAAKYMVRALKYDKVADIKGIFSCSFKDKNKISPDLIGYVTIAQGLKIINGNNGLFNPKAKLTRAQTAIIIYNYLQG